MRLEEDVEKPKRGEYVQIIVEPVYDVLPSVRDEEQATVENSPGWEWLHEGVLDGSKVYTT